MRRTIIWAAAWHFAWGLLLVPYTLAVTVLLDGPGSIRSVFDGLVLGSVLWVAYLVAALPLNVVVAALAETLLGRGTLVIRRIGTVAAFAVVWFVAIQFLLPIVDITGGLQLDRITIWAASAGALYGLVLTHGADRMARATLSLGRVT